MADIVLSSAIKCGTAEYNLIAIAYNNHCYISNSNRENMIRTARIPPLSLPPLERALVNTEWDRERESPLSIGSELSLILLRK